MTKMIQNIFFYGGTPTQYYIHVNTLLSHLVEVFLSSYCMAVKSTSSESLICMHMAIDTHL